MVSLISQMC